MPGGTVTGVQGSLIAHAFLVYMVSHMKMEKRMEMEKTKEARLVLCMVSSSGIPEYQYRYKLHGWV